jgi:predicted nucleotidyltransferase
MSDESAIDDGRQAILDALERHEVRYVVIGGAAAQARGWQEPTDDIDVTPERSEDNLTRLAAAVAELDAGFRVDPMRYPDGYLPLDGIDARTFRNLGDRGLCS